VVDDAFSMWAEQQLLASAVSDLVTGIVNPRCVDHATGQPAAMQPAGPLDACPAGTARERKPVLDLHVGVISSALGGFGADACPQQPSTSCSSQNPSDDHGHLLTRGDACGSTTVPTYQGRGFLAFDPQQQLSPPGEGSLGGVGSGGM